MLFGFSKKNKPAGPKRLLFVDQYLGSPNGAAYVIRDLACYFAREQRYKMSIWSPRLGSVADEFAALGVEVVSDLMEMDEPPDLIHAQHLCESAFAAYVFPDVPMVRVCHGILPSAAATIKLPMIRAYIAVSVATAERVHNETGVEKVIRIPNFYDAERFYYQAETGPNSRAVLFTNHAKPDDPWVTALTGNCQALGISMDLIGTGNNNATYNPEQILTRYGLIFAVGRSAIESTALGIPVVLCDPRGVGEQCLEANFDNHSKHNFALAAHRLPYHPHDSATAREIIQSAAATPKDVLKSLSEITQNKLSLEVAANKYSEVYERAMRKPKPPVDQCDRNQAIRSLSNHLKENLDTR